MTKVSPIIFNDKNLYLSTDEEVNFTLNARRIFDCNFGSYFDSYFAKKSGFEVGFIKHTSDDDGDEEVIKKFFLMLRNMNVNTIYSLPTGYKHDQKNIDSIELTEFKPPLIGKCSPTYENFSKIRGGQIGLYAERFYTFSACLTYSMLDSNGEFTLFLGPRIFVEELLGMSIEKSWDSVRKLNKVNESILPTLKNAMNAYNY